MNKLFARVFALATLAASICLVSAQVPVGPFTPSAPIANNFENFDSIAPGSYVSLPIMGGAAAAARFSTSGLLVIDNSILPAFSAPNCLWGRGTPVEYRFAQTKRWFGGFFRVPSTGVLTTSAMIRFFLGNSLVGVAVASVNTGSWQWHGWFLSQGFNRLIVAGNNTSGGYIGMDNIRVRN